MTETISNSLCNAYLEPGLPKKILQVLWMAPVSQLRPNRKSEIALPPCITLEVLPGPTTTPGGAPTGTTDDTGEDEGESSVDGGTSDDEGESGD